MKSHARSWLVVLGWADQFLAAVLLASVCSYELPRNPSELCVLVMLIPWWHVLHSYFGLYESHRIEGLTHVTASMLVASTIGVVPVVLLLAGMGGGHLILPLVLFNLSWLICATGVRAGLYAALHHARREGHDLRHVCIIGSEEEAARVAAHFQKYAHWGLRLSVLGRGDVNNRAYVRYPSMAPISGALEDVLRHEVVDEILIAKSEEEIDAEEEAILTCRAHGLQCRLQLQSVPNIDATLVEPLASNPDLAVPGVRQNRLGLILKRMIDIAVSGVLLILLLPVLLLTAILVRISSPGPVIFRQQRVGFHGRRFWIYKFRTMVDGAEAMLQLVASRNLTGGPTFKAKDDLRVTPLGRILRRLSLDEFPQLWNVLRGEMSLVGPRPLPLDQSSAIEGEHRRRFAMRPGLTCSWQVAGRSTITFDRWMQMDIQYVDQWSLATDTKLLLRTIPAVIAGRGAY